MNLIEQLGGYNAAILKRHVNYLNDTVDTNLINALLQYRRENNIYEVGDDVVLIRGSCTLMYKLYERIGKNVT